mmetsp:Transcript_10825/g.21529  ORF Transcript_10825/g.21529 Transcript_10825/m.21529 type:complete len:91 (-) Transcript_10825:1059-1331(-)
MLVTSQSQPTQHNFPKSFYHNEMRFVLKYVNKSGEIGTYRCPYYRRGCKAGLTMDTSGNIVERSNQHLDPDCYVRNATAAPNSNQESSTF